MHGENERQFYCNLCESSSKSHVERIHERIRKLWYCEICNKEYATIRRMKEHVKRVHENFNAATFDCELCNYNCDLCDKNSQEYCAWKYHYG